ncbi:MAG: gamma-glutamyltransferase family protein [Thermomicrobiales bacterium]
MTSDRTSARASNAMIATPHHLATDAGLNILRDGGSAMDAVIAANSALTVLYPDQTSIGGDCFFLVFDPAEDSVSAWNGSGPAPAAATADELLEAGYDSMPRRGPSTITVPGTIDGWFAGHDRYGKLDMAENLRKAVSLARDGFPVSPRLARAIANESGVLNQLPYVGEAMMPGGRIPNAGDMLVFPKLASSLELIGLSGRDVFYTGSIAESISTYLQDIGGWLTADDLASYQGEWVEPLEIDYRGTTVIGFPPNSQGITSLIALGLMELEDVDQEWDNAANLHVQIEAKKRAFRVRDSEIADPRFCDIDTSDLLSKESLRNLWSDFDPEYAGQGQSDHSGDTVYLTAVDSDGLAVSMIQSMFQAFGSGVADPQTGIILQNRGSSFSLNPERRNVLEAGKRPRHTLMPSMMLLDGTFRGSFGTQGGDVQAQVHIQLAADVIDHGFDPQQAIDLPRWLSGGPNGPNEVLLEQGFPEKTIAGLARRGHGVIVIDKWNGGAGHAQMILRDPDSGDLLGGADPRADGKAEGI